jgi:hypothetical protein
VFRHLSSVRFHDSITPSLRWVARAAIPAVIGTMGDSDSPAPFPLRFGRPSARQYRHTSCDAVGDVGLSTLRSFPSRSRGRTATQGSLPAGGQPLPGGGHDPARSQMKFQPHLHGFLLIQAFATQSTSELRGCRSVARQCSPGSRLRVEPCITVVVTMSIDGSTPGVRGLLSYAPRPRVDRVAWTACLALRSARTYLWIPEPRRQFGLFRHSSPQVLGHDPSDGSTPP